MMVKLPNTPPPPPTLPIEGQVSVGGLIDDNTLGVEKDFQETYELAFDQGRDDVPPIEAA